MKLWEYSWRGYKDRYTTACTDDGARRKLIDSIIWLFDCFDKLAMGMTLDEIVAHQNKAKKPSCRHKWLQKLSDVNNIPHVNEGSTITSPIAFLRMTHLTPVMTLLLSNTNATDPLHFAAFRMGSSPYCRLCLNITNFTTFSNLLTK